MQIEMLKNPSFAQQNKTRSLNRKLQVYFDFQRVKGLSCFFDLLWRQFFS